MIWRTCKDCGEGFWVDPSETWKVRCLDCWRERKNSGGSPPRPWSTDHTFEVHQLRQKVWQLEGELQALRALEPLAAIGRTVKDRWRDFIFLTHPDRHGGHPKALEITSWINSEVRR
jgi:hypothetical protein